MPHQLTCVSALSRKTGERENASSLKCCISALPEFNQLLDFFNLFDSQLILTLLYDSLSLVINALSYRDCSGHGSGERKSIALQQLDCVARTMHQYLSGQLQYVADLPSRRRGRLRSSTSSLLAVCPSRLVTIGDRSFAAAGPRLWNSLPVDVQSAPSLTTFRRKLKTHLFRQSYPDIVF